MKIKFYTALFIGLFLNNILLAQLKIPKMKLPDLKAISKSTDSTLTVATDAYDSTFRKRIPKRKKDERKDTTVVVQSAKYISPELVQEFKMVFNIIGLTHENFDILKDSFEITNGITNFSKSYNSNQSKFVFDFPKKIDLWDMVPKSLQKILSVTNEDDSSINMEMKKAAKTH